MVKVSTTPYFRFENKLPGGSRSLQKIGIFQVWKLPGVKDGVIRP